MGFDNFKAAISDFETISEGVYDPNILKAVFLGGAGGSGKGFIGGLLFSGLPGGLGLKFVNTDTHYEYLMKKAGLSLKKDVGSEAGQALRAPAKRLRDTQLSNLIEGRLGLILDSTGTKPQKIISLGLQLDKLGYDLGMVFVNTSLEVSLERNRNRERVVPEEIVRADWKKAQAALPSYRSMFGKYFIEIDNSVKRDVNSPEFRAKILPQMIKAAEKLYKGPVRNPIGKAWIKDQLAARQRY